MNIYQKLQDARIKLQNLSIKKSGNNKFANYDYMELGDFLPHINNLMKEEGLASFINFTSELAILTLVNSENPEEMIQFTSPMSTASLKGCHDVQNLGAVQTYLRRYLYINAFEIVEHDALDSTTGSEEKPKKGGKNNKLSDAQVNRAIAIGMSKGIAIAQIKTSITKKYNKTEIADLTKEQYDELCSSLEKIKVGA